MMSTPSNSNQSNTEEDTLRVLTRPSLKELDVLAAEYLSDPSVHHKKILKFIESKGYTFDEWARHQLDKINDSL